MVYTCVDSPLWYLQWLEKEWDLDSPLNDQILTLKHELRFMRTYFIYLAMSKGVSPSGSSLLIEFVEAAIVNATKLLSSACRQGPSEVGPVVSHMLEKLKDCKQEIREAYAILWDQPWKSKNPLFRLSVMEFVDSVLDNLKDLLGSKSLTPFVHKNLEILKEKLSFIRGFIEVTEKRRVVHQKMEAFLTYVQVVTTIAACLSYSCWIDEMDSTWASRMAVSFFDLLQLIKPCTSDRVDMYLELLKASKTDEVGRFVNFLLENSVASVNDQVVAIHEELIYLIKFLMEVPDQSTEDLVQISADIKAIAKEVGLFCINKAKDDQIEEMNNMLSRMMLIKEKMIQIRPQSSEDNLMARMKDKTVALHEGLEFQSLEMPEEKKEDEKPFETASSKNIDFIKAELFLLELQNHEVGLMVRLKDQAETLQEGLKFLRTFLMNPPQKYKEEGELILTKCEAMAIEAVSLICTFFENVMKEDMAVEMNLMISELLGKIEHLKEKTRQVYLKVPPSLHSNLPDGLVFISSLLGDMRELLDRKSHSLASMKHHIEILHAELESLKTFLMDTADKHNEHEELKDLWTCITDVAYEAEYMIDSSVFGDNPEWCFMLWFPTAIEKIKLIKSSVKEVYDGNLFNIAVPNVKKILSDLPSWAPIQLDIAEVVVGLNDEEYFIIDQIIRGTLDMNIMSIIAPPGFGKTTLAKKVYYNRMLASHFQVQAWCSISQEYRRQEMLRDVLGCIVEVDRNISQMSCEDIAEHLYKSLKRRRYLIVIDNLWDTVIWDDLSWLFPNDHNGSRVLFTTQLRYVALRANPSGEPYPLRLLSEEESWELLQQKMFFQEACPPELSEVGKHISVRCKGMPLIVVLTARLLALERNIHWWKQVAKSYRSNSFMDILEDVFDFCYRHLPDHLKSCFLFFGAFPMNSEISVSKLFRLWIAEGFLPKTKLKTLEHVAEEYLADLIDRNLVTIAKRSSSNGIKACRVHDLLWDFCTKKAKHENFFQRIHGYNAAQDSNPSTYEQRRLCIFTGGEHFIMQRPSSSCVRCLFCSASSNFNSRLPLDFSFISRNFKLLRVLDLESINVGDSFPTGLELLELLRYLAVSGDLNSVPSSIAKLWNLETFLLCGYSGAITLPNSFWKLQKLRHVHILPLFSFQDEELEDSDVLNDIVSLSGAAIFHGKCVEILVRRCPYIKKLSCIFITPWKSLEKWNKFPALDLLESLKISFFGMLPSYSCELNFPINLKKLTLSRFGLPWRAISTIGMLPNLEVLKLLVRAFEGEVWEAEEGEFCKLKYLKLDSLNIAKWKASSDSFPLLKRIVLHRCKHLVEIPSSFGDICTLEMIEVQSCSLSVERSAKLIHEEQLAMGNDYLKVNIGTKNKNF